MAILNIRYSFLAFDQAFALSIYLKSNSITITKGFKQMLLLLYSILHNFVGALVHCKLINECADDQYHTW